MRKVLPALLLGVALIGLAACSRSAPTLAKTTLAEVVVDFPTKMVVTDYEDFTGRTEPIQTVDVRSRVTGYLDDIHFKDGEDVAKDQLLFAIDPKTYQATLDQADATVSQAQARLKRLQSDYDRLEAGVTTGSVTREEFDRIFGDRAEAVASVSLAKATKALAETNFKYTTIKAPLAGRISRRMIDRGNLVKADDTILTTIVALNKIYTTFDIDERTLLRLRKLNREGKTDSPRKVKVNVEIGLADEEGFPRTPEGKPGRTAEIDFIDNKVDPATGTLRVRAVLDNADLMLSPGLFVRVRIPVGRPHEAVLVPEAALGSDQGLKYVYVVNADDEVVYRRVEIGQEWNRQRSITSGVLPTDRVIVSGLQRVRPGVKVSPKKAEPAPGPTTAVAKKDTPEKK